MKDKKEQIIAVIFSIVGSLSIIINLTIKGFTTENWLDAIKDLVGLLITIAVFLLAYSISKKSRSFTEAGKLALDKLKRKYNDKLEGPEYDKSNYNPDDDIKSQRMRYLFFSKNKYNKKVAFIPLDPLEQGILDIHFSKSTLVNFGHDSKDTQIEALITETQNKIFSNLKEILKLKYSGLYDIQNEQEGESRSRKYPNSAIIIDFREDQFKMKSFEKAVYVCAEKALEIILPNIK